MVAPRTSAQGGEVPEPDQHHLARELHEVINRLHGLADELAQTNDRRTVGNDANLSPTESSALPFVDPAGAPRPAFGDMADQHELYCQFLGQFRLFDSDRQLVRWRSRRSLSLLMFLAAHHPSPVHSEVLMDAFWPSAKPKAARNSLHVAIYGLRRSFEDCGCSTQHVVFDSDFYGFAANLTIATDVDAFEAAATRGTALAERGNTDSAITAYREALSLYRGVYVENDPYADWAQNERRRLHGRLCRLLDDLSRLEIALGDLGSCVTTTMRLIEIDPYDEAAHRRLMRAYALMGRHHLAIEVYEAFATRIASELESLPEAETQSLVSRVRHRGAV